MPTLLEKILTQKIPCIFVSPHLDDAVLSCGGLLKMLAGKTEVRVVSIFTEAGTKPETLSARTFLKQCGISDAQELFSLRREEDKKVLGFLNAFPRHLGFIDSLWRKKTEGNGTGFLSRLFPELVHIYPTYRFHITRGRVSPQERDLREAIKTSLEIEKVKGALYFFPLGLGKHVDHVLTHEIGLRFPGNVIFYSDFPYNLTDHREILRTEDFQRIAIEEGIAEKPLLIKMYKTQPLFSGEVPLTSEEYFVPKNFLPH